MFDHFTSPYLDAFDAPAESFEPDLTGAPREAKAIYMQHHAEKIGDGESEQSACRYALRMLNHAGWFDIGGKWTKVHGDNRTKVNVRKATRQADGTYVIPDVDVFYPNSVKGEDEKYTADDIRRFIKNTNLAIEGDPSMPGTGGGQKPALLEGHPNAMQAAMGTQLDSHGFPVAWKESPRGAGYARCTLIHVTPEMFQRLADKKLTGISAGFAKDTDELNKRFGHVALLGGTTQALSHLPMVDVYESDYLSFSAEPDYGVPMKMNDMQKKAFSDMAGAYAAYAAAESSGAAGEPGSEAKMNEAMGRMFAACRGGKAAFDSMTEGPAMGGTGAPPGDGAPEVQSDTPGDVGQMPQFGALPVDGEGETHLPVEPELKLRDQAEPQQAEFESQIDNFMADDKPHLAFQALAKKITNFEAENKKKDMAIAKLQKMNQALNGKLISDDWSMFCAELHKAGHVFEDDYAKAMFENAMASTNPRAALKRAGDVLKKSPKAPESLAGMGQVFDANAAAPRLRAEREQDVASILTELSEITGRNFSANDWKIGSAFSSSNGKH